jgi:cytochrome c oxidase subunit II
MRGRAFLFLCCIVLAGCGGSQSTFEAHGPAAESILTLSWVMVIASGLILFLVVALTAYAIFADPERRRWLASSRVIVGGGIVFPVTTLTVLLIYGLVLTREIGGASGPAALRVEVIGEQFWWRVHYLDGNGRPPVASANEIRMPTGAPVEFVLKTSDVIHSFWVPSLGGKLDMIPGQVSTLRLQAGRPGIYRGQCAEYCGAQHAQMAFYVVAEIPEAFDKWLASERGSASEPGSAFLQTGKRLFIASGCGACHAVRGTEATGAIGPDLTHVGSRRSIAAGIYPNNAGTVAGWIASAQHLKPGNKMPSFDVLRGEELRAVASYLESLK